MCWVRRAGGRLSDASGGTSLWSRWSTACLKVRQEAQARLPHVDGRTGARWFMRPRPMGGFEFLCVAMFGATSKDAAGSEVLCWLEGAVKFDDGSCGFRAGFGLFSETCVLEL